MLGQKFADSSLNVFILVLHKRTFNEPPSLVDGFALWKGLLKPTGNRLRNLPPLTDTPTTYLSSISFSNLIYNFVTIPKRIYQLVYTISFDDIIIHLDYLLRLLKPMKVSASVVATPSFLLVLHCKSLSTSATSTIHSQR